jgi:hypothetical protein
MFQRQRKEMLLSQLTFHSPSVCLKKKEKGMLMIFQRQRKMNPKIPTYLSSKSRSRKACPKEKKKKEH